MLLEVGEYERRGTVDCEHVLTAVDHRRQRTSEDIREHARESVKDLPPLPDHVLDEVVKILSIRTPANQLMRWWLRLYCGHIVEETAHASYKTIHAAFMGGRKCEKCGMDPSTIVAAQAVGLVEDPPETKPTRAPTQRDKTKRRITKLEAELSRLRSSLGDAE